MLHGVARRSCPCGSDPRGEGCGGSRRSEHTLWGRGAGFRYLKQIQDLPLTGLPQMNLLEMYNLKDEMGNLR